MQRTFSGLIQLSNMSNLFSAEKSRYENAMWRTDANLGMSPT